MDGLTFVSKLVDAFAKLMDALAWPIVAIVLVILLRPQLLYLFELVESVKFKGAEVAFRSVPRTPGEAALQSKDVLEQFWRPDGRRNLENEAKLRAWMRSKGIEVSITAFLNAAHLEATRQKAVEELRLDQQRIEGSGDAETD